MPNIDKKPQFQRFAVAGMNSSVQPPLNTANSILKAQQRYTPGRSGGQGHRQPVGQNRPGNYPRSYGQQRYGGRPIGTSPAASPKQHAKRRTYPPKRRRRRQGCSTLFWLIFLTTVIVGLYFAFFAKETVVDRFPVFRPLREITREVELPDFYSESLILIEVDSGKALYANDSTTKRPPASLTKMMTVLVACEQQSDWDKTVAVDTESYQRMVAADSSMAGFYGKEPVTVRDLIYGTMLPSGGEAASTLAIETAGSEAAFVELMNAKAKELGMTDTHFANPTGLDDPAHYSTAFDLSKLVRAAIQNPQFRKVFTAATYTSTPNLNHPSGLTFRNSILREMGEQEKMPAGVRAVGGKAGYTKQAGRCWATLIQKGDSEYIAVTLASPANQLDPLGQKFDLEGLALLIP